MKNLNIPLEEQQEILETEDQLRQMNELEGIPNYEILDYVRQHKKVVSRTSLNFHEAIAELEQKIEIS